MCFWTKKIILSLFTYIHQCQKIIFRLLNYKLLLIISNGYFRSVKKDLQFLKLHFELFNLNKTLNDENVKCSL